MLDKRLLEQREHAAWSTGVLDLETCSRLEIVISLYEQEKAGPHPNSWPQAVRNQIEHYVGEWAAKNTASEIVAVSYAAPLYDSRRSCVLIVHHRKK